MAERTSMSLPAAKDLRAVADRATQRAALRGRPRERFLRQERARVLARLLPILALVAVATGAAAFASMLEPPASTVVAPAQGATAAVLAVLAIVSGTARRSLALLRSIAFAAGCALVAGWGVVTATTGGASSPWLLAIAFGLTVVVAGVPLLPWQAPALAALGAIAFFFATRGASSPLFSVVLFAVLGAGGFMMARARRRRALVLFRKVERLAAAVARIRKVQDQLVVVEKLEALRVLVGGMAHELNNALAVSVASTEQIVRVAERDPPAAAKAAQRAQGGLSRIRKTIDRLKRFALAEEGVLESADLAAMLDFALESAIGRARSGVMIDRAYEEDVPAVDTHVAALAEALFQIARNAVESMPAGGTIRAAVRRDGGSVLVSVADEGKGIPAGRLDRVFDPFYARDATDTARGAGRILAPMPGRSGLGLSAVYGLVSAIGGSVEIKSEVGKGTEVAIRLAAAQRPPHASSRPPPAR